MRAGADTSFVLRLLTGDPAPMAEVALQWMRGHLAGGGRIIISGLVVAEAYYALHYHYQVPKAEALARLKDFMNSSGVEGTGCARTILSLSKLESLRPGFVDRMIVEQYLDTGADEVVTFERAASKMAQVHVMDPGV